MAVDPVVRDHLEWLGYLQPVGLVVSAFALAEAGVVVERSDAEGQRRLVDATAEQSLDGGEAVAVIPDFPAFAHAVLGWSLSPKYYAGTTERAIPDELHAELADGSSLAPDLAVAGGPDGAWQLLVRLTEPGADPDEVTRRGEGLELSEHQRLERLLRATGTTAGVLCTGRTLRLVSAPPGETSGWLDFHVADLRLTAGRAMCSALRGLLGQQRLLVGAPDRRLGALLLRSRRYQNRVSDQLADQVLHALYELLRGFQAADDAEGGALLDLALEDDPDEVYRGLLTVALRLVFLLYAEERGMLPDGETFVRGYSLAALYERLRDDAARHPDTMTARYGAWAHLLVLFRLVHDGTRIPALAMPARRGVLFDPNRFGFLEGRRVGGPQAGERITPPRVPDATVHRVLEKLLVLGGERLSYRALDVEQIGSVYQTMMGFRLERALGPSVAVKAKTRHGAPTVVRVDTLLAAAPAGRTKLLKQQADRDVPVKVGAALKTAGTLEEVHAALRPVIDHEASPDLIAPGAMVLQPSDERRKSGSHYTPRELTAPIVRTTLAPLLERLKTPGGRPPTPAAILELKVCDPALGSGAFLVESCRQLADALVEAWGAHGGRPELPADEDELVLARRMVAQRCLYGVDRNPVALDLAKLSLWLITLARDHPLTFVDHALRHGDALVGVGRKQIEQFHWTTGSGIPLSGVKTQDAVEAVKGLRRAIREAGEDVAESELRELWEDAEVAVRTARAYGDLLMHAFFGGSKLKEREALRARYATELLSGDVSVYRSVLEGDRHGSPPLVPFHWELELPEVFDRERPGFDAIVGNPPFAGKNTLKDGSPEGYLDWLKELHEGAHGNADLVAHFFRRAFGLLRSGGRLGLIATNTIRQGDTRATGLRWICQNGGTITQAQTRVKWPGLAAVVVAVVHVEKGEAKGTRLLNDRAVEQITAFLVERGGHEDPAQLRANNGKSYIGCYVLGMGFTFDDTKTEGPASSLADMERLLAADPRNAEVIRPYLGGKELATSPTHEAHRYVIDFGQRPLAEARAWPDVLAIVDQRVRPERLSDKRVSYRNRWWLFAEARPALRAAIKTLDRVLVISRVSDSFAFAFVRTGQVFNEKIVVFRFDEPSALAVLQSRPHEIWTRFFSATLKDDLQYSPSDCFSTFPFPPDFVGDDELEAIGAEYEAFRAELMVANDEGLTKTCNRFHDPEETAASILRLRELHDAMDRAVLDAYGWTDIPTACGFLLDYEVDDDEGTGRKAKRPWRYRWPDEVRDEVLARLLELNAERAAEEQLAGVGG